MFSVKELKRQIGYQLGLHHKKDALYRSIPVNDKMWELVLKRSFEKMGAKVEYDYNSHRKDYDLKTCNIRISCKSGRLRKYNGDECYIISSHRLGRFPQLSEKISFLKKKEFDVYYSLSLIEQIDKKNGNIIFKYRLVTIPYDFFKWSQKNWKKRSKVLKYKTHKFNAEIRKSMSDQLWLMIPTKHIKNFKDYEYEVRK